MPSKATYERRKAAGVCTVCGKNEHVYGKLKCQTCIDREKKYYAENRDAIREHMKKRTEERIKLGLCIKCSTPTDGKKTQCEYCLRKDAKRAARWYYKNQEYVQMYDKEKYQRLKDEGKCVTCANEMTGDEPGFRCFYCMEKRRINDRMRMR